MTDGKIHYTLRLVAGLEVQAHLRARPVRVDEDRIVNGKILGADDTDGISVGVGDENILYQHAMVIGAVGQTSDHDAVPACILYC